MQKHKIEVSKLGLKYLHLKEQFLTLFYKNKMFYSNVRHQSIRIFKFQYKLYFLVNIGDYRILSTNLICLAEIG